MESGCEPWYMWTSRLLSFLCYGCIPRSVMTGSNDINILKVLGTHFHHMKALTDPHNSGHTSMCAPYARRNVVTICRAVRQTPHLKQQPSKAGSAQALGISSLPPALAPWTIGSTTCHEGIRQTQTMEATASMWPQPSLWSPSPNPVPYLGRGRGSQPCFAKWPGEGQTKEQMLSGFEITQSTVLSESVTIIDNNNISAQDSPAGPLSISF